MFKNGLAKFVVLAAMIFVFGLMAGMIAPRWFGLRSAPKTYSTATILKQVQTLAQLVTVQYVMEKFEEFESAPNTTLGQFLTSVTGEPRILLLAHGVVKAGVDLSQMGNTDLQIANKKIVLKLPRARITDAYLDETLTRVIQRENGHSIPYLQDFKQANKDMEQTVRQNAIDDIRRAARRSGILKDAEDRARAQLTHFCRQLGFEDVDVKLKE
jgi:hypothetical protein